MGARAFKLGETFAYTVAQVFDPRCHELLLLGVFVAPRFGRVGGRGGSRGGGRGGSHGIFVFWFGFCEVLGGVFENELFDSAFVFDEEVSSFFFCDAEFEEGTDRTGDGFSCTAAHASDVVVCEVSEDEFF